MCDRPLCRHCEAKPANRPRGLCWGCYYNPGVLALYPSTSKYARQGVGNGFRCGAALPERTDALPGTEDKIAVLARRAAAGLALHHPDDPVLTPCPKHDFSRPARYNKARIGWESADDGLARAPWHPPAVETPDWDGLFFRMPDGDTSRYN
jgi:hypothetical protein